MCFILLPAINSTATQFCIIEFNNRSDVDSLEPGQESVCLPIFFHDTQERLDDVSHALPILFQDSCLLSYLRKSNVCTKLPDNS